MEKPQPLLCELLLRQSEPGLHEYHRFLSSIDKYYTNLHVGMQNEALRDQIVLNPDQAVTRLQKSFSILKNQKLSAPIIEEIFKSVVNSLVDSPDNILSIQQSAQLVGSVLPIVVKHPGAYLRLVANLVLAYDGLFERLVADEKHSPVMKAWLLSKKTYLDIKLLRKVTEKLVAMCEACSGHGVGMISETWDKVVRLDASLESMIHLLHREDRKPKQENLPSLEKMKMLTVDDKKSNQARPDQQELFKVPQPVLESLRSLNMQPITSAAHASHARDSIQNETMPELMRKALESFPCRVCLERLDGAATTFSDPADRLCCQTHQTMDTNPSIDIFGKTVGLWKVLLSDAAMKNAKKLARTGGFSRVELKLRELASGEWKGKDLSHRIGSKRQKQQMQIPVLQVRVTRTVSILWQLDVGFDHEAPGIQQQVVKVWQITTSDDEVDAAIDQIINFQSFYRPEIIQLCQQRPGQQHNGTFFPNKSGPVEKFLMPMKPMDTAKTDQALVEMSNKFYNMTDPFLNAISEATGREEFPFDLSPEEMDIVRHFDTSSLILGRSGTGKTTCLLFKILAKYRARQSMPDEKSIRQLLLTRSPFLAAKLQIYVRSLIDTQSGNRSADSPIPDQKPESFFALKDEDFPFVCTYDEFLDLLENTFRRADRQDFLGNNGSTTKRAELQALDKPQVVDFNAFKTEYWGSLSGIAPSGCSPELLFAEIMGVVKGSGVSVNTLNPLTRTEYLSKTSKVSPAFASEIEREKVYQAFDRYERLKKQRMQIDELDRVSALLKSLKENSTLAALIRQCFEEIYVDEIQDLRCLDVALLLNCLCDARGIHLAGDTAQCISKDSAFRFPEIKALFYEYYEVISKELNQASIAKPVQFMLAKNYRSHQGILSFASWVMRMLWNGFPETIDKLDPEIGQTSGPKPIIFAGFDSFILSAKMIGLVKLNDQVADFGAEQVILVRDEASKNKLQAQIGEIALVLTILESKGMEFDDVLVYDFFSGSGLGSSYRCLHLLAQGSRTQFDSQKHAALCSELRQLYVAVTRARKQLWFMETVENSIDPVFQAPSQGNSLDLADLVRKKDHDVAAKVMVLRAGASVDPERWLKRAAHLLHQKSFADALFCFRKANDPRGIAHSQALLHEQEGRSYRADDDHEGFTVCYGKAILLFLEIGLTTEAANCYQGLGRYDKAAELCKSQGQLHKAAAIYEKGGHFREASGCFHSARDYEQAIEVLRRGDAFDELIHYINQNCEKLNPKTLHRYSRLCNILLKQGRISTELRATTINLLGSDVEKLAFFKEFEMWDQMRQLFAASQRWLDYFELSVSIGDLPAAVDTLLAHRLMPVINQETAEITLHFAMTEILLARCGVIGTRLELEKDLVKACRSTPLEKLALQWLEIFDLIDTLQVKGTPASFKVGDSGLLTDFFSLFAIAYEREILILDRAKVTDLPTGILIHTGSLLQRIESSEPQSVFSLCLLCGLWSSEKSPTSRVALPRSPLKACGATFSEDRSSEGLFNQAKAWIRERFATTVARFDDCARVLINQQFPKRCLHFVIRGFCSKARQGACSLLNARSSTEDCISKLTCTLRITEVFAHLSTLYYQRVMPDSFQKAFLGRRRHWMQNFLDEVVFVSSYEQSAVAIVDIRRILMDNSPALATASILEDLLFYRVGKEWHAIHQFTGILEQVQIAHFLGPWVAARYTRALVRKIDNILFRQRSPSHPLRKSLTGLQTVEKIRWAIAERNFKEFYLQVKSFLVCVEQIHPSALSRFHSLIAIIEFISTYLLGVVNPQNAVVIPRSWALQYLPVIHKAPVGSDHTFSEQDRATHLEVLRTIVLSFCKVVENLEHAITSHGHTFTGMGFPNLSPTMPMRHIFDYLTTVALNLYSHPNMPRGMTEIWEGITKVLPLVAPWNFGPPSSLLHLRESVTFQYADYNGKDSLEVICLDDSVSCPSFLRAFVFELGGHTKLSAILEVARIEEKSVPTTLGKDASDADGYTRHELEIITNLQRRWRRVMKVLSDARHLRETVEGRIFTRVFTLCFRRFNTLPSSSHITTKEKIRLRKLLFTDGISIMVDLEAVSANLRRLKEQWKARIEDLSVTAEEIEGLDEIYEQILPIEMKLNDVSQTWSINSLHNTIISVPAQSHIEWAREAQRIIWAAKQEIGVVRGQIEAVGSR